MDYMKWIDGRKRHFGPDSTAGGILGAMTDKYCGLTPEEVAKIKPKVTWERLWKLVRFLGGNKPYADGLVFRMRAVGLAPDDLRSLPNETLVYKGATLNDLEVLDKALKPGLLTPDEEITMR